MYNQLQTDQYLSFEKQVKTVMLSNFSKIENTIIPGDSQLFRGMNLCKSFQIVSHLMLHTCFYLSLKKILIKLPKEWPMRYMRTFCTFLQTELHVVDYETNLRELGVCEFILYTLTNPDVKYKRI